jgi:hypothetical protein
MGELMPRLPGKKIAGTDIRRLDCGCLVKYWPVTGRETITYCKEHETAAKERWKRANPIAKFFITGYVWLICGAILVMIVGFLGLIGWSIYKAIFG